MVFWIKDENGNTIRLDDSWTPSIYVGSDSRADLDILVKNQAVQHYIKSCDYVSRFERIGDNEQSKVLELTLADSSKVTALANVIADIDVHNKFRLYNIDVLPYQSYFYERDLFPLAKCRVDVKDGRVEWQVTDSVRSTSYQPPEFKVAELDVTPRKQGHLPSFDDKIDKITLKLDNEIIEIQNESETDMLSEFMKEIASIDPDFIFTSDGKNDALKNCHVTF